MKLYRRSLADVARTAAVTVVNAAARLAEKAITAFPNTTDEPEPTIPAQRTHHTIRTACVHAAADEWQATYPLPAEAWLLLDAPERTQP